MPDAMTTESWSGCPTHFVEADPDCAACRAKGLRPAPSATPAGDTDALNVSINGGRLVISIGVETLAHAYNHGEHDGRVAEPCEFARDVVTAMQATMTGRDMASRVEHFFDEMMSHAAEFSLGVVFDDDDDDARRGGQEGDNA
jgi:hypothetical protein